MLKKNRHGRQAADRMELQHATFERSLRIMSKKIVTLNEEIIKNQIKEIARGSIEGLLYELLEAKAKKPTLAIQCDRNEVRYG